MDLKTFHALLTPAGQKALEAAAELQPREVDFLGHFTALSRRFPVDLARAALEIAILRRGASNKFPFAHKMYFTRPALEQASSNQVASYRASRLAGFDILFDLGCSVGGDTPHMAAEAPTIGIDRDPLRLAMAQANIETLAPSHPVDFLRADLSAPLPIAFPPRAASFFDPGRRKDHRRVFSVADYSPPLSAIENWLPVCPALSVKISPGVDLDEIQGYDAEVEFISLSGELKEAVLWFGPLKTAVRRATVLPGGHTFPLPQELISQGGAGQGAKDRLLPLSEPRGYLYEPDPSILRAGLVGPLGLGLEAAQLDPDIAYLTSDRLVETPFARSFRVESWMPFQLKRLRAELRARGVDRVVVKKRGSPISPEELIRKLRLPGRGQATGVERILFLTHLRGQPIVVLCYPPRV